MGSKPSTPRGKREIGRAAKIDTILDATEQLIIEDGYAAVSTRKVAHRAGLAAPLVHYYFKTTDDLLIAVYRRASQASLELHKASVARDDLVAALVDASFPGNDTVLALEFLAMANHRKAIRSEIAASAKRLRILQAEALSRMMPELSDPAITPLALSIIASAVGRALVMEANVGMTPGHAQVPAALKQLVHLALLDRSKRKSD